MKKWMVVAGVVLGVLLVVFAGLTLFIRSYLKSDAVISLLVSRLEALTGRKVQIREVNVSFFTGIVVKGLTIKQRDGSGDFVRTEEFILDYRLKPLLRKQLVIDKIEVVSPYVFIRRERDGTYNFNDIKEKNTGGEKRKEEGRAPFALLTDRIVVKNARVEFVDARGEIPPVSALIEEVDLKTSVGRSLADLVVHGHIIIKSITTQRAGTPVTVSGRVDMKDDQLLLNLTASPGKEVVRIAGTVREYRTAPEVQLSISAKELDVEKLLALGGGGGAGGRGTAAGSRPVRTEHSPPGRGFRVKGDLKVDVARYQGFTVRNLAAEYAYRNGVARIEPLSMSFAGGEKVSAEGTGTASLAFRTDSGGAGLAEAVKRSLTGKGAADLSRVQVQRTRITDALALYTGIEEVRAPRFEKARFTFLIKDEKVSLEGRLASDQLRLTPAGTIGFDKRMALLMDLSLSPQLSAKLPRSAKITGYIKDREGWSTIPLRISGTLEKPSVGLNTAGVGSQLKKGIAGEIERRIQEELRPGRKEGEQSSGAEELLKGLFGK